MTPQPRPYQVPAIKKMVDFFLYGFKPSLMVLPVAWGKSWLIAFAIIELKKKDPEAKFLVTSLSKELIEQDYEKYVECGGVAGIYSASLGRKEIMDVTFATIASIESNPEAIREMGIKYLIIDEAHVGSDRHNQAFVLTRKAGILKVCGLTASPIVMGKSLGGGSELRMMNRARKSFFTEIIHVTQPHEVIDNKSWTPINYIVPKNIREVSLQSNTTGADFTEKSTIVYLKSNRIKDRIVEAVKHLQSKGRKHTLIFVRSVEYAHELKELIPDSEVIHGKVNKTKDRPKMIADFKSGKIKVMINVDILGTGFDFPEMDSMIHARPTKSVVIWYQHVGRLVRIHPDKKDTDLIDFSGNFKRFGRVEDFTFEKDPILGWGMFSGDRLLTNVDLSSSKQIFKTKTEIKLVHNDSKSYLWPIGKHKGTELEKLPKSYLEWICSSEFVPTYESGIIAKQKAEKFLCEDYQIQKLEMDSKK